MKRLIAIFCILCLIMTSFMVVSADPTPTNDVVAPGNYIANGDFEDATKHNLFSSGSATTADAHSGTYSWAGNNGAKRAAQNVTVPLGKKYILSAWVRHQDAAVTPNSTHYVAFYPEGAYSGIRPNVSNPGHVSPDSTWRQLIWVFDVEPQQGQTEGNINVGFFSNSPAFYADDFYLGQVAIGTLSITGDSSVLIPATGSTSKTYTTDVKNQVGTTDGLENTTVELYLAGSYPGVSLNAETGVLTVDSTATPGTIGISAVATANINDLPDKVETRYIELKQLSPYSDANLFSNGDFVSDVAGWTGGTITYNFAQGHNAPGSAEVVALPGGGYQDALKQTITVEEGKRYIVGGYFKNGMTDATPIKVETEGGSVLTPLDGSENYIHENLGTEWQFVGRAFTATASGTADVKFQIESDRTIYADDMYASEVGLEKVEISGDRNITVNSLGSVNKTYTVTLKNQCGNSIGVADITPTLALSEEYAGISLGADGVLTVTNGARAGNISLTASASPLFNTQSTVTSDVFTITVEKVKMTHAEAAANNAYSGTVSSTDEKSGQFTIVGDLDILPGATYIVRSDVRFFLPITTVKQIQMYGEVTTADYSTDTATYGTLTADNRTYAAKVDVVSNYNGEWVSATNIVDAKTLLKSVKMRFFTNTDQGTQYNIQNPFAGLLAFGSLGITPSESEIYIPADEGVKKVTLTASPTNQFGDYAGVGGQVVRWSLKENYNGVSINSETGELSITSDALTGDIDVVATCTPNFNTEYLKDFSETKTLRLMKAGESSAPQVRNMSVEYTEIGGEVVVNTLKAGETLEVKYDIYQKDNNTTESGTQINWYKKGENTDELVHTGNETTGKTYTLPAGLQSTDLYYVTVTPSVLIDGVPTAGAMVTSINLAVATPPTVENITVEGDKYTGNTVSAKYDFVDANSDKENTGATTFQWYRGDSDDIMLMTAIPGATSKEYTLTEEDEGKYIAVGIKPVALVVPTDGTETKGGVTFGPAFPTAKDVQIMGKIKAGETVTASYRYYHPHGFLEEGTEFVWKIDGTQVSTRPSYTLSDYAEGSTLTLEVKTGCQYAPKYGETVSVSFVVSAKTESSWGGSAGGGIGGGGGGIGGGVVPPQTDEPQIPTPPAQTSVFTDVTNHWAKTDIEDMANKGIINGVGDKRYEPDRSVTRSEFIAMLIRIIGIEDAGFEQIFADVVSSDWYYTVVQTAYRNGLVKGRGEGFEPLANITREETAIILINAYEKYKETAEKATLDFADTDKISDWALEAVEKAVGAGLIGGDDAGMVNPSGNLTRGEAATVLSRLYYAFNGGAE